VQLVLADKREKQMNSPQSDDDSDDEEFEALDTAYNYVVQQLTSVSDDKAQASS
jgi:hypothetical protein